MNFQIFKDDDTKPVKAWVNGVNIEDEALEQTLNVASLPFIHSHVALTHNTNIDRLKGITQKDMDRTLKYYQFYLELMDIKRNASRLTIATINDSYEKQVYNRA